MGDSNRPYRIRPGLSLTSSEGKRLIEQGRREVALAKQEMPGLMSLCKKKSTEQPLKGARIAGSLHMTVQTVVLIETLSALGASVRWSSCNRLSTQDHAAAYIASQNIPIFAWKGMCEEEYWECIEETLHFRGDPPNMIIDDGGDLTRYLYEKHPALVEQIRGISEETTTGARQLYRWEREGSLRTPCIDVNGSKTKSFFDNLYGTRESFIEGLQRATDFMVAGKTAVVAGYGPVGRGCVQALKSLGAHVVVTESDPIAALTAAMEGNRVVTMEEAAPIGDLFVTATGCIDVIVERHFAKMKNGAYLANIGHFDREIAIGFLQQSPEWSHSPLHSCLDQFMNRLTGRLLYVLGEGRLMNLACGTGHPSFVMSLSFCNQVLAQLELWQFPEKYPIGVHTLPKELDEEVAKLHLDALQVHLTELTPEQVRYRGLV